MKLRSPSQAQIYHGWLVVAAAFLIALFAWGLGFYGLGIYLVALQERHGWSTAEISPAITVYYLSGATLTFFAGNIFERFGARRVVFAGVTAMACGLCLLTLITRSWQVYAVFAVMSLGWATMGGAAINIIVAPWFDQRRGFAVSMALNGASAGGVIIAPLLVILIDAFDFNSALWSAIVLMLVILMPIAGLVLRSKNPDEHDRADNPTAGPLLRRPENSTATSGRNCRLSALLRDRRFHTISIPFALGLTAQVGFLTHQLTYLSPILGAVAAGWAIGLTAFAAVIGRIGTGLFIDKVNRRTAACANFLLQVLALALLISSNAPMVVFLSCSLFGLGVGNMISLPAFIVHQEFLKQHFSQILSFIVAINQITFAFGPGLLGYLQQQGGSYTTAFAACIGMEIVAALIVIAPSLRGMVKK